MNGQIDEDNSIKGDAAGYASNQTATLTLLKESSNQLDVPMDKVNYRSFEHLKKPANDQSRENSIAVPQVYETKELNNIILSNDFTAYNNYQEFKNQRNSNLLSQEMASSQVTEK